MKAKPVRELSGTAAFLCHESNGKKTPRFARTLGKGLNESSLKVASVERCLKDEQSHGSVVSTNAVCGLLESWYTCTRTHTDQFTVSDHAVCVFSPLTMCISVLLIDSAGYRRGEGSLFPVRAIEL